MSDGKCSGIAKTSQSEPAKTEQTKPNVTADFKLPALLDSRLKSQTVAQARAPSAMIPETT